MIERPPSRRVPRNASSPPRDAASAEVPEPDGYRLEDYRAPTPATLRGAKVIGNR